MVQPIESYKIKAVLKDIIIRERISYEELSSKLKISKATVKRILNSGDLNVSKLIDFCSVLNISFYDVVDLSKMKDASVYTFSEKQEIFIATDFMHFLILRSIVENKKFESIQLALNIDEAKLKKILIKMDSLDLIQFHSNLEIILKAKFPYKLIENGPIETMVKVKIEKFMVKKLKSTPLNKESETEMLKVFELPLSEISSKQFKNELELLYNKYKTLSQYELSIKKRMSEQTSGIFMLGPYSLWSN
jgi:predicted transcriptional regulator